jgi:hypothetical protein
MIVKQLRRAVACAVLLAAASLTTAAAATTSPPEPNVETALKWWTPQRDVWTPIGWKDHLFRFTVLYNGSILCAPAGLMDKPHIKKYVGKGFQLNFNPSEDGSIPPLPPVPTRLYRIDGGLGMQSWRDGQETPVLRTDYPCSEGVVLREEVFAHVPGGKPIKTGVEPLYAWVRLSVVHVDPIRAPKRFCFGIQLSNLYCRTEYPFGLDDSVAMTAYPAESRLTSALVAEPLPAEGAGARPGLRVLQQSDRDVRLLILPGGSGELDFAETAKDSGVYRLKVDLPVTLGATTDILVPMLPQPASAIAGEAKLGFDGALKECESFWSQKPATAARIHTPETYINDAIARNVQFAQIIAERNPDTGEYAFLSGSYGYDAQWATPTSMICHMFLDLLGYHESVARHVELYRAHQGSIKPPGPAYHKHPGYFSTPKTLTSYDWLTDHGAVLETLSRHALLSGDDAFIRHWLDPIVKACDFIKDASAATNHDGVKGLMPPAVATDTGVPSQAVWNQAWIYKGLTTAVRLLQRVNHPRAAEFASFAADFRRTFEKAFREEAARAVKWTDPDGRQHPLLPTNLIPMPHSHVFDDAFLLDTGPLVLPWAGLFDASDPDMVSFADYFRVGPPTKLWGPRSSPIARAILHHEISSCEPCYSWNIVNSWRTGDRRHFLEGMYALLTGAISNQTFVNCEHRNAMYGNIFVAPLMTWSIRQSVIDDQLADGELHLLRLAPLAWVSSEQETVFENMPTEYGPVDLRWRLSQDGHTLDITFKGRWRQKPGKVVVHAPPVPGLKTLVINGQATPAKEKVELPTF